MLIYVTLLLNKIIIQAFIIIDNDPDDHFMNADYRLLPDDPGIACMTRQLELKKGLGFVLDVKKIA